MSLILKPATGPACPDCGCRDSTILREAEEGSWWGQGEARCGHCGKRFRFAGRETEEEAAQGVLDRPVIRERLRCPQCRSADVRAYVTRPERDGSGHRVEDGWIVRYHKCLSCESRFKTVEQ